MNAPSAERRNIASFGGATAALNSSSMMLFKSFPHTPFYSTVRGLAIGLPIAITVSLIYRMKRRDRHSDGLETEAAS